MKQRFTLLLALLLGTVSCSGESTAAPVLSFSAIPDQRSTELTEKYSLLARRLEELLEVPVRYVPVTDYEASVAAFKNGDIQLAWFGGLTGVQARTAVPGARALAQGRVDPDYRSYFVAHVDTGIEPSDAFPVDLEGRSFTFGSRSSTSGRLMPEQFVRQETGQAPEDFFAGPPGFSGSHDKTAELVESGTYEAGALNFKVYDALVAEGRLDPERCRRVWTTPGYPDYNWTAHPDLETAFGAGFLARLQEALVSLSDPELLAALQRPEGFVPARNEDYAPLEVLARELGLLR